MKSCYLVAMSIMLLFFVSPASAQEYSHTVYMEVPFLVNKIKVTCQSDHEGIFAAGLKRVCTLKQGSFLVDSINDFIPINDSVSENTFIFTYTGYQCNCLWRAQNESKFYTWTMGNPPTQDYFPNQDSQLKTYFERCEGDDPF
jgi:hypothetical protein